MDAARASEAPLGSGTEEDASTDSMLRGIQGCRRRQLMCFERGRGLPAGPQEVVVKWPGAPRAAAAAASATARSGAHRVPYLPRRRAGAMGRGTESLKGCPPKDMRGAFRMCASRQASLNRGGSRSRQRENTNLGKSRGPSSEGTGRRGGRAEGGRADGRPEAGGERVPPREMTQAAPCGWLHGGDGVLDACWSVPMGSRHVQEGGAPPEERPPTDHRSGAASPTRRRLIFPTPRNSCTCDAWCATSPLCLRAASPHDPRPCAHRA